MPSVANGASLGGVGDVRKSYNLQDVAEELFLVEISLRSVSLYCCDVDV